TFRLSRPLTPPSPPLGGRGRGKLSCLWTIAQICNDANLCSIPADSASAASRLGSWRDGLRGAGRRARRPHSAGGGSRVRVAPAPLPAVARASGALLSRGANGGGSRGGVAPRRIGDDQRGG